MLIFLLIIIGGYNLRKWIELKQLYFAGDCKSSEIENIRESGKENEEELQEVMPKIIDVVADGSKVTVLCEDGSVWSWDKNESRASACKISNLSNVTKIMYAGPAIYALSEDGTVFSIMDNSIWEGNHINDFIFPTLPIELPDLSVDISPLYLSDIFYVDLREGTKYGTTILYELGQAEGIKCMDADKYTVFAARENGTLWYWNSKMIEYHDCKDALADSESCKEDYSGYWEKVNIKEILNITDESDQLFNVVDICAGSENVLFLTDDGQVFISEYVTSSTEDIEYYNQESTNPDRDRIKKVKDISLKTISFRKLDWENIISINSDGLYCFSAVDEAGRYFYVDATS